MIGAVAPMITMVWSVTFQRCKGLKVLDDVNVRVSA